MHACNACHCLRKTKLKEYLFLVERLFTRSTKSHAVGPFGPSSSVISSIDIVVNAEQGELRRTRESLAQATRELETLRPSRDQLRCAWDEARRAREELDNTRRLGDRMSARAAAAEAQAEESR